MEINGLNWDLISSMFSYLPMQRKWWRSSFADCLTYKQEKQDLYPSQVFHINSVLAIDLNVQKSIPIPHHQTTIHNSSIVLLLHLLSLTCVDHKFKYLNAGNLISCSAHALVTFVKAKLKHSKLPKDPLDNNLAKSWSVDRDGNVSFLGPPFCCNSRNAICRSQTFAYIFKPVGVDCNVDINCNLWSRFSTASKSNMAQSV